MKSALLLSVVLMSTSVFAHNPTECPDLSGVYTFSEPGWEPMDLTLKSRLSTAPPVLEIRSSESKGTEYAILNGVKQGTSESGYVASCEKQMVILKEYQLDAHTATTTMSLDDQKNLRMVFTTDQMNGVESIGIRK